MRPDPTADLRELLGRERKLRKLCAALDLAMVRLGVQPADALAHIEQLEPGAWVDLARRTGYNTPSTTTIAAIIAIYRDERPALLARMGS